MEVIVYIYENTTFEQMGATLDSLTKGKIKPTTIIFCDNQNIRPSTFRNWIQGRCIKTSWRTEHIREDADFNRCLDLCMKKASGLYVGIFNAGFIVPEDFISSLDIALNDDLERFLYLEPCDIHNNGIVVHKAVNKIERGNLNTPLIEKLRMKVTKQECQYMIRKVTEIVPSMTKATYQQSQLSSPATTTNSL